MSDYLPNGQLHSRITSSEISHGGGRDWYLSWGKVEGLAMKMVLRAMERGLDLWVGKADSAVMDHVVMFLALRSRTRSTAFQGYEGEFCASG